MRMMIVKKMTWIVATILVLAVTGGCGQPKSTPEEAALIYCNAIVKGDFTDASKIRLSREDQTKLTAIRAQGLKNIGMSILGAAGILPSPDRIDNISASVEKINRKIEFKTELVSKEANSAIVKVSVRSIDSKKLSEILTAAFESEASEQKSDTDKANFIVQVFANSVDKVTLAKEVKTFKMKLELNKMTGCWEADKDFLGPLGAAVKW